MIPFVMTPIKWLPYPENKPHADGCWWLVYLADHTIHQLFYEWELDGSGFFERKDIPNTAEIIYYSDLFFSIDPASEDFNFTTAVELMKAGNRCKSVQSGIILHVYDDEHETVFKQTVIKNDNTSYWDYNLSYDEILGKWRLA